MRNYRNRQACDTCELAAHLRSEIQGLRSEAMAAAEQMEALQLELHQYYVSGVLLTMDEKMALWEIREKRRQAAQAADDEKRQAELDSLMEDLE